MSADELNRRSESLLPVPVVSKFGDGQQRKLVGVH